MQQRLAPGKREDERAELRGMIDPALLLLGFDRSGKVVILVAVPAREVAPPSDDQLHEQRTSHRIEHAGTARSGLK